MGKKSFILYLDLAEAVDEMDDEEAGKLMKAIFQWQRFKEVPLDIDKSIKLVLITLISQFKRDDEKWEDIRAKRSEAGRNGAKQKLANAGKRKQNKANQAVNGNVNVNVNVNESELYSSEPPSSSSKPVLEFPCVGDQKEWQLCDEKITEWQNTYQGIDVLAECKKARQWIIDSPTRKKTARGMPKFINGWLCRATDNYRPTKGCGPMEVA